MIVDSLSLYAYADKSQQREREVWRRFLLLLLPVLLEADADELTDIFDDALVDDPDVLVSSSNLLRSAPSLVHIMSATLALALGLPAEFGLAAFLESNPPTRVHAQPTRALRLTDEDLMSLWLTRFTRIQADDEFLGMAADWKERLHAFLKGDAQTEGAPGKDDRAGEGSTSTGAEGTALKSRSGTEIGEDTVVVKGKTNGRTERPKHEEKGASREKARSPAQAGRTSERKRGSVVGGNANPTTPRKVS